jgi:inositol hexakisphosphate
MVSKGAADYIIYNGKRLPKRPDAESKSNKPLPMTRDTWLDETADTVGMYKQLTLFPMEQTAPMTAVKTEPTESPQVPHEKSFRFLAKDTQNQIKAPHRPAYPGMVVGPETHPKDAVTATNGELYVPGKTEIKKDQFPGRVHYTEGGLYPPGDLDDPKTVKLHANAPNYRKMPGMPVHGVGQPTAKGFEDVVKHLDGKNKPVVWANTRAEAVIYINGEPHNLREMACRENLVLKDGASGAEIEALEEKLKQRLIQRGSIEIVKEGSDGKPIKETVRLSEENTQTTKDVVERLREDGYKVEYKRIPIPDETSPEPARLDEMRQWQNEMQEKHPDKGLNYVVNCHQGRGRTTTGMVATGIALDGRTKQLELPFGIKLGEDSDQRADRIIDQNFHMQNLRETVDETRKKSTDAGAEAKRLESEARTESDARKKAELERQAKIERERSERYDAKAQEFTKRYAQTVKYSEYIDEFGAKADTPTFEEWMKQTEQTEDLNKKWAAINSELGLGPATMAA